MQLPVDIYLDNDGLLRKECPICEHHFKIFLEDNIESSSDKYYCPSCGIPSSSNSFFTKEQVELSLDVAKNYMTEQLNQSFKGLSKSFKNNKMVNFKFKPLKKTDPRTIVETSDFEEVILSCCNDHVFVFSPITLKVIYCPRCGEINFPG